VSAALQTAIESYGIRARFRVVPNAVDQGLFHPPAQPPDDPPTRLVNVALHSEVKGLDVLLRAFAALAPRRPELVLEQIGEGSQARSLERLASDLGLGERARFLGKMDSVNVAEALRRSHVFVLASLTETFGVAVIEALCCGLPIAATSVGGVTELVNSENGVLAPAADVESLAEAIGAVLDDYRRFDRMEIARRARERFSLEAVGQSWDEIYRSV
jgi:glycosyltransferase involved in cell wall biosynthesis